MQRRTVINASLSCALLALAALARAGGPEVSGNATVTSDYVFRGVSQTRGAPALQAGMQLDWKSGWYFAPWASNVNFEPGGNEHGELDLAVGWAGEAGKGWALDVSLVRYTYPGHSELNASDLIVTATHKERYFVSLSLSEDALGLGDAGGWIETGGRWSLRKHLGLEVAAGRYVLPSLRNDGYSALRLELTFPFEHVTPRLDVHWASDEARDAFGEAADARVEAAVDFEF